MADRNRVLDLRAIVHAKDRDNAKRRKGEPLLVSPMPLAMGPSAGELRAINKSAGINVVEKYAPDAIMLGVRQRTFKPDVCIVDYATIIHQAPPLATFAYYTKRPLRSWKDYACHQLQALFWQTCAQEGKVRQVIICCDKRDRVPAPKAFAHVKRDCDTATPASGEAGAKDPHRIGAGSRSKKRKASLCSDPVIGFGRDDATPQPADWQAFLAVRQNRDNVFYVVIRELKEQLESIKAGKEAEKRGEEPSLSTLQLNLQRLDITIDGEPIVSADFKETTRHNSWRTGGDGVIIGLEENGIGEGEGQAIRHARIRSEAEADVNNIEIMSIDTDQWMMGYFYYTMAPEGEAGSTRIVVRQQKGIYRSDSHRCIDTQELYRSIVGLTWPRDFSAMARSLPLIVAFVLSGTDFTPSLYSITALHMFETYFDFCRYPKNLAFVRPLSAEPAEEGDGGGFAPNLLECIKFVGLSYFKKNRGLFGDADPGRQVDRGADAVSEEHVKHDELKPWIDALQERLAEKRLLSLTMHNCIPAYDVIDEHVKRLGWVGEYWFKVIFGMEADYPIGVPDFVGKGYAKAADDKVIMVMRRSPLVTLRPGEGIAVQRCRCKPLADGVTNAKKCTTCACKKQRNPCSQLCACQRTCQRDVATDGNAGGSGASTPPGPPRDDLSEEEDEPDEPDGSSDDDDSDSDRCDRDGGEANAPNPYHTVSLLEALGVVQDGFDDDDVAEYTQNLGGDEDGV